MPEFTRGDVTIHYEEQGAGFPLLLIPGGGLNSHAAGWPRQVFDCYQEFSSDFRVITMDQRNANGGSSTGPIELDDPWGAFADDQVRRILPGPAPPSMSRHMGISSPPPWAHGSDTPRPDPLRRTPSSA